MKRIVVLGSGEGTNFSAIVEHFRKKNLEVEIHVISDLENSGILRRAKMYGIPGELISRSLKKEERNSLLFQRLTELNPDLIVLAGYMLILPPLIVRAFFKKIVNIHPALLPAFKGAQAIEDAFRYGVKWTGVTIHYVDEGVDTGPIIAQIPVPVYEHDTLETMTQRIHGAEHYIYPLVIEKILGGERIEGTFEYKR
ncbi:MAG: phosphoribosylglycinamide formyltransferase [Caldiserica bacterium]|jgi:phosphoribosylglycinamide formyltransferase-1|nr:phosphoribosylglycinamide formyltransferase [Caldisericota bacterium]